MTDEYLDRVTLDPRGATARTIVLVDPDPDWPRQLGAHRRRILVALGGRALRVEHIGSTSVPGQGAKPRIDVLLTVADPEDPDVVDRLEDAGYRLGIREPGHRCLTRADPDANVHVWSDDDPEVVRCLLSRDQLRVDAADRARYQARKEQLAAQLWTDVNFYAEAKDEVIESVIARARETHERNVI